MRSPIPRQGWLRRKLEAALLRLAARLLMSRNVTRSLVITRSDNNDTWYMAERLDSIARRVSRGYDEGYKP
ncbi:hypothetical protein [Pseudomonas oryzihabitans]|uniref:hypothetical protein n=1 Tax=Pseudomonas oryzihabitans TaxID=47885 RepID=UPI0028990520|nr:hypothetical protein [Pseudomonas oryzihabitans]